MKNRKRCMLVFGALVAAVVSIAIAQDNAAPSAEVGPVAPKMMDLGPPIKQVRPKYPKRTLQGKIQGEVLLEVIVSGSGKVESVSRLSGDEELAAAAANALRKWRYPTFAVNEQNRRRVKTTVTISFKIGDDGNPVVSAVFPPASNPAAQVFKVGNDV